MKIIGISWRLSGKIRRYWPDAPIRISPLVKSGQYVIVPYYPDNPYGLTEEQFGIVENGQLVRAIPLGGQKIELVPQVPEGTPVDEDTPGEWDLR